MIVVRVCGGLGNQLFQYAVGRRLAAVHQTELVLDTYWYAHTPPRDTLRTFELLHYPVQARLVAGSEALWCRLHGGRIARRLPFLPRRWKHFSEKGFAFDAAVLRLPDEVYLDGYWQCYRYFEDLAGLIRAELSPIDLLGAQDKHIAQQMRATRSVSVHVRRGDYVSSPTAAQHGVCGLDYYSAAVDRVRSALRESPEMHFFVFSDDPSWARENLVLPGGTTFVTHNGTAKAFQDLRLMSLCKHHVVANSSFSWWGAWLNPDPGKLVICPRRWFADDRDTSSLAPSEWIRL